MCRPVTHRAAGVEVRELHPAFGELIDVRRLDELLAVAAQFKATEVVGDYQHDVRWPIGSGGM
jgi:hypothetical protein